MKNIEKLHFITHSTNIAGHIPLAGEVIRGGCRWIQLRMKDFPVSEIRRNTSILKKLCLTNNVTLIINDHVDIAKEFDCGVHLGKEDMNPLEARAILGNDAVIGATANTFEDIKKLYLSAVDYIGLGPFRFTKTKKKLSPILGMEGYKTIINDCIKNNINIPIIAIGGIQTKDIKPLMGLGINGIAVSSLITDASNHSAKCETILNELAD